MPKTRQVPAIRGKRQKRTAGASHQQPVHNENLTHYRILAREFGQSKYVAAEVGNGQAAGTCWIPSKRRGRGLAADNLHWRMDFTRQVHS